MNLVTWSDRLLAVSPRRATAWAVVLTLIIAGVDYVTGPLLRLFPLYFVPVSLVAATGSERSAAFGALLATCAWSLSNYLPLAPWTYALNVISQGFAFFVTALLVNGLKTFSQSQKQLALTDPLTGLRNFRAFRQAAELELERQRRKTFPLTVAYLDVDDFKAVNSKLGHVGADELLADVARAMQSSVRATDIVARLGGDEFAVLLPEADETTARRVLERLKARVLEATRGRPIPMTFSIGAVVFTDEAGNIEALLSASDAVMYEVKALGKNRVLVLPAGNDTLSVKG